VITVSVFDILTGVAPDRLIGLEERR